MENKNVPETLHELGFKTKEIEDYGYLFAYEDLKLLYNPDDDDAFLRISAPCIYEVENEDNRAVTLDIINEVNCRIKYSKTMLLDDSVWVSYEARIFENADLEDMLRFAIMIVQATVALFHRKMNGGDDPTAREENNDTETTDNNEE